VRRATGEQLSVSRLMVKGQQKPARVSLAIVAGGTLDLRIDGDSSGTMTAGRCNSMFARGLQRALSVQDLIVLRR